MSMKEEFLNEIREGDYVMIYYGDKVTVTGTVIKLTTSSVRIEAANGSPRIALDSIISYDTPEAPEQISESLQSDINKKKVGSIHTFSGVQALVECFQEVKPLDLDVIADWNNIKTRLENREYPRSFRNEWNNLTSNFTSIRKQIPKATDLLEDKMRKITIKVRQLILQYPDAEEDLHELLASMYFQIQMYSKAETFYVRANDYLGAIYAAYHGKQAANINRYLDEYVRFPGQLDPYIYRLYAQSACQRKSVLALSERIRSLHSEEKLDEKYYDELEYLNACAFAIASDGKLSWQWAMMYSRSFALRCLEQFIMELPENWEHIKVDGTSAPDTQLALDKNDEGKMHISAIEKFDIERLFGFISASPDNYFFYINQVNNEDELRKVLAIDKMANNLEVQFKLGKSRIPGKPAAYNIFLTERGAAEAKRRLDRVQSETVKLDTLYGSLETYDQFKGFGKIYSDIEDKPYNVILSQIVDPYLQTYLETNFQYGIRVAFYAGQDKNGKNIAIKVRFAEDKDAIQIPAADIQYMIRCGRLTQAEMDNWPEKRRQLETPKAVEQEIKDLYTLPYEPLEPINEEDEQPVDVDVPNPRNFEEQPIQNVKPSHLPPLEPLPKQGRNRFTGLTPLTGSFYESAHKQMLNGNLEEAERLYIRAIRAEDRLESAVADLVTVFLRNASHVKDAIDLMDAYGVRLSTEKRLNLLIQIYQKIPEKAYRIKLCYLLDEAINLPLRVNAKFHYLGLQGNILRALGEYQMALNSCKRWYQLYDAEVQYRGPSAVTQFANSLNFVKRIEATCDYLTGETLKAETLAKELLRVSTEDTIAQQILDGTLDQATVIEPMMESGAVSEEEIKQDGKELSNFVKDRLDELLLNKYLKSYALVNGEYTGNTKTAKEDIRFLLEAPGQTPSIRSERLLCAAKIVLSVQKQFPKEKSTRQGFQKGTEKKYIARSMAAYGDSVLQSQQEQDTARYAYLQAIGTLSESETDWHKSVNHYIGSYFHGKQDIARIVEEDSRSSRQKSFDLSIISRQQAQDVGEFILGMLKLHEALQQSNSHVCFQLVSEIRRSAMLDSIVAWLEQNEIYVSYQTTDQFNTTLNLAHEKTCDVEQNVKELMERLPGYFLSKIQSQDLLSQLCSKQFQNLLCYTDRNYLNQICNILVEFRSYFTIHDFQTRSASFDKAIRQSKDLIKAITANPTSLSYDVFRPALNKTQFRLQEEWEQHYRNLPPEIEIGFTVGVQHYLNNDEVNVHLTIRNGSFQSSGNERQLADNIDLKVVKISQGVEYVRNETDMSGCVYGGKEREAILVFRVLDPQIFTLGSFDVTVECAYRYDSLPGEGAYGRVTFNEPVVFHREHRAKIPNPFHKHVGQEMEDEDMFKGREEVIAKLIATMKQDGRFNYGHGILMYGQTRAGKSSIRIHFTQEVRKKYPDVIQVDMKNLDDGSVNSEYAFYTSFLDRLGRELKQYHTDILDRMRNENIELPEERVHNIDEHPDHVKSLFTRYLGTINQVILPAGKMILLVADEFSAIRESIVKGMIPEEFMQHFKALLENYRFFAVCFGQDDIPQFIAEYEKNENSFARMEQRKVTYLDETPAKELMDAPIAVNGKSRYTPAALDELYELTSGSAYLIIKVCDLLVDYLNSKGAENITPGILQNFLSTRVFGGASGIEEGDFEPQLKDRANVGLKETNRSILLDIARHSETNGWAEIDSLTAEGLSFQAERNPKRALNELLSRLRERDVIEIREGNLCRIKVALLSRWLLARYGRG